ncbi:MAG: hypothetical protein FWC91_00640 [Defluviitaleaceae bacterium]|nr:hypothetical protein [Defluviitaleaceae bacterium]
MFVEAVVFLSAIIGCLLALSAFIFHMITRQHQSGSENSEKLLDVVADEALEEINRTSQLVLDELNEKYKALLFMYQLMDDKQKAMDEISPFGLSENPVKKDPFAHLMNEMKSVENRNIGVEYDNLADQGTVADNGSVVDCAIEADSESVADHNVEADSKSMVGNVEVDSKSVVGNMEADAESMIDHDVEESVIDDHEMKADYDSMVGRDIAEWSNTEQIGDLLDEKDVQEMISDGSLTQVDDSVKSSKLPTHPRYNEIRELKNQGLSTAEIAKRLGMGQGEVSLIIGLSGR